MKPKSPTLQVMPFEIVGATKFGRYSKISAQQTFNMITSDGFSVPYSGYKKKAKLSLTGTGRGNYYSKNFDHLVCVVGNGVYTIDKGYGVSKIAEIGTYTGDVFFAENNKGEIGITDRQSIYMYNFVDKTFKKAIINFSPNYLAFKNGRFISADRATNDFRFSDFNDGLKWGSGAPDVGRLQTKADRTQAVVPIPGKGNLVFVFGKTVAEIWSDVGASPFSYKRNEYQNIDYGCLNVSTIATAEDLIVWLAANEKSGPVIMMSTGGAPQPLSDEGISYKLSTLKNPEDSYAFMFNQDGHVFYQITFPTDNLTYTYDFKTQQFYSLSDENMNYHIAKNVAFFNNKYVFVSSKNGYLYEMDSEYYDYDGKDIPRILVTKPFRMPDSSRFIVNNVNLIMESGSSEDIQRIDCAVSKDGGVSFSNFVSKELPGLGYRKNRVVFWNFGIANDVTFQFRFYSKTRFVVGNGTMGIYQ